MLLTTERLSPFIGGQIAVQETGNFLGLFRGEIREATVDGFDLKVKLAWFAKNDGEPGKVSQNWTAFPKTELKLFMMGWDEEDRLIRFDTIANSCTLYPQGHTDLLDRNRVKGL